MPGGGVDHREVQVADDQDECGVHEPVVEHDRAREAEPRVALAEPEEQARSNPGSEPETA
jgi:hypothetical protein